MNTSNLDVRESNIEKDDDVLSELLQMHLEEQIQEKFHRSFLDKKEIGEILDMSIEFVEDLIIVYSRVQPCFPPKYKIFEFYKTNYLKHIYSKIKPYLNEDHLKKSPGNLILVAKWLDRFEEILRKVGLDIKTTEIGSEIEFYMYLFYDHVDEILSQNITSILEKNLEDKKNIKNDKNLDLSSLNSFYATDIFRSLYNVIEVLSQDVKGQLLFQIIKVVIDKVQEIQKSNDRHLEELTNENDLIISCVYILDAHNCIELLPDFKKKIKKLLQKEYYERVKLFISNLISIFNFTIKLGCQKAIEIMFIKLENQCLTKIFR
jgi:hypothetical protein